MSEESKHDHGIHINLDSARPDLKPLLDQLNPILQRVIDVVKKSPDPSGDPCSAGYHNVTVCDHDDKGH